MVVIAPEQVQWGQALSFAITQVWQHYTEYVLVAGGVLLDKATPSAPVQRHEPARKQPACETLPTSLVVHDAINKHSTLRAEQQRKLLA